VNLSIKFLSTKKSVQNVVFCITVSFAAFSSQASSQVAQQISLQSAVQQMLDKNPQVQAAYQDVLAVENDIKIAKSGYLPKLDLELGVGKEETLSPATDNETVSLTREEAELRLSQVIYDGFSTKNEVALQKARHKQAVYSLVDAKENAALRTSQAYINILRESENLGLLEDSLDEHKRIHEQMSQRSDAGVGSKADLNQVTVRLSLATNSYIVGKKNLLIAQSQFKGLVGYIPDESDMEAPKELSIPSSLEESLKLSFENHPVIKSALASIDETNARSKAAKSANHPTLALEGSRTWNNDIDGLEGRNEDAIIALRFRYNILNGGKDKAQQKKLTNQLDQATEKHRQARWETEEGIRLSWHAYEATAQQLEHLIVHVDSATATKKAYDEQYKLDKRSLIELLNAQNELTRAKQTYLNAKYDQAYSQIRVLNSTGQLTKVLGVK